MRALEEAREGDERRIDARFALVCCVLANCNRDSKQRPYRVEDFMPKHHNRPKNREELEAKIRNFCGAARAIQEGERIAKANS